MASGVAVDESCREMCQQVKMHLKGKQKRRYAVFKISDDLKRIVVDEDLTRGTEDMGEETCHFDDLVKQLPEDDGRYVIYDYAFDGSFGKSSKMILVLWCPCTVAIKKRMIYASSKDALKKSFPDVSNEFQADGPGDLDHCDIQQKLRKN